MAQDTLTTQDLSLLEKFKAKAQNFSIAFNTLKNMDTSKLTPEQKENYSSLLSTGDRIYSTIEWITSTVDSVTGFFSGLFSFNGADAVSNYIDKKQPDGLGLIPLIPIAAITGALAVMSKFAADVYLFERKMTEQNKLIAQGATPTEAANIVKKIGGSTALETIKDIAKPVSIAFALWGIYKIYNIYANKAN